MLRLRRDRPELFTGYRPLPAQGPAADHVVAFSRGPSSWSSRPGCRCRLTAVGRDTVLPAARRVRGTWHDLLTGTTVDAGALDTRAAVLGDLLSRYPVALLLRGDR